MLALGKLMRHYDRPHRVLCVLFNDMRLLNESHAPQGFTNDYHACLSLRFFRLGLSKLG